MHEDFPQTFRVRQHFDAPACQDIESEVARQLKKLRLGERVHAGQSVAITAGSRGIANIARIIKSAVQFFQGLGAKPFIVPAMGSHGGGTADGQRRVIESYGVTEDFCGCPIRASMETVIIGEAKEGFPVYFDRHASTADHVLVCNRIKPHTGFTGDIQSGLLKMLMIGLGKKDGATLYHKTISEHGFPQIIRSVAPTMIANTNILAGLAIVENAEDETAVIEAVPSDSFMERETELLRLAKQMMPSLGFSDLDVLLIDQIGKNISGSGMDTNIVGRKPRETSADQPRIKLIIVRNLTPESHGNATGLGIAEICLSRLVEQMDRDATVLNCVTACHIAAAKVPVDYPTDERALHTALGLLGMKPSREARLVWIRDTLNLVEMECSEVLRAEVESHPEMEALTTSRRLPLNTDGMLPDDFFARRWNEC